MIVAVPQITRQIATIDFLTTEFTVPDFSQSRAARQSDSSIPAGPLGEVRLCVRQSQKKFFTLRRQDAKYKGESGHRIPSLSGFASLRETSGSNEEVFTQRRQDAKRHRNPKTGLCSQTLAALRQPAQILIAIKPAVMPVAPMGLHGITADDIEPCKLKA
jgi:hypothetical protein